MMIKHTDDASVPVGRIDRLTYASDILEALMILFEEGSLIRLLIGAAKAEADLNVTRAYADPRRSSDPPKH